jgi:hypothetical protein
MLDDILIIGETEAGKLEFALRWFSNVLSPFSWWTAT